MIARKQELLENPIHHKINQDRPMEAIQVRPVSTGKASLKNQGNSGLTIKSESLNL